MGTTAVIGAGMAGAGAARALTARGFSVRLFDKSRGAGGRMSTRRAATPLGDAIFDHGAQGFTARDPGFVAAVALWADAGVCSPWSGRLSLPDETRWVGVGGMSAVGKAALAGLDATFERRVAVIEGSVGAWTLRFEDGTSEGPFDAVLTAVPAEQTAPLLAGVAPDLAAEAAACITAPCWTVLAVFDAPIDRDGDGLTLADGPLAWAGREASKPGRGTLEAWTLQASADWSRAHLEDDADEVAQTLLTAFGGGDPAWRQAHRWRYARVERAAGSPCGWDATLGLGTCGDWRLGPRVESAWLSGTALGRSA